MPSTLDQLSDGALDWLGGSLDHFDPYSSSAPSATHTKAKAALELALLCHCASRLDGGPGRTAGATALVRTLSRRPDFPELFDAHPGHAATYGLICAALAPDGADGTSCRSAALARVDPGFLSPRGKSAYQRIEIRHYADKAGVRHTIEPYAALVPLSPLVADHPPAPDDEGPLTTPQAYALTHTAFYLGDFGRTDPGLTDEAGARAGDLVRRMLDHSVAHDRWDLAAELVLTQFILGTDPLRTPSGVAALECLAKAQLSDGSIPGRSAALRAGESDTAGEFFRRAYHTTLVTALMALIVSSGRPS
ncbi:hypothetical protein OG927_25820 [Streptomyces clavifer]|uniref:DUF6895 family protein n=1 Tax=Streptomyces clavifer TaxID=68188 RepID=UPI002E81D407|nr:hypothetical protein [Streptomyces clavifer]WUC30555.1 hypothetical protein OG927_25820 [Streptomyces clavifer]